jgi:hypothetical protein
LFPVLKGFEAFSCYPLQSFFGEKPQKGFPLLSGLGFGTNNKLSIKIQ